MTHKSRVDVAISEDNFIVDDIFYSDCTDTSLTIWLDLNVPDFSNGSYRKVTQRR